MRSFLQKGNKFSRHTELKEGKEKGICCFSSGRDLKRVMIDKIEMQTPDQGPWRPTLDVSLESFMPLHFNTYLLADDPQVCLYLWNMCESTSVCPWL